MTTSFAFDGVGGRWVWFEEDERKVPLEEIRRQAAQIEATQGDIAKRDFLGLVGAKLKLAEQGKLQEPGDGRSHLYRAAGVMEIKWSVEEVQWRLYYGQPLRLHAQRAMLGLHFSRKDDFDQQDRQIDEAARRWTAWQARS